MLSSVFEDVKEGYQKNIIKSISHNNNHQKKKKMLIE